MTDNASTWELGSGLPDDFDCEVVDAWFATDSRYNNGNTTLLFWKIETDEDMAEEQKDGGTRFSCGADWSSPDGGLTVDHPSGKTKFGNQSAIGMLIARAIELGAGQVLMDAGPAQQADVWVGTKWHMKRDSFEYTVPGADGKPEKKTGERLLPSAFNGKGEGGVFPDDSPATSPEPAPSILNDLSTELVGKLQEMKANTPSHSAFVDKAMELTDVTGNTTLVMALATPDGVYAEL